MRQMKIRKPISAGTFYPQKAEILTHSIQQLLESNPSGGGFRDVKVLIVPQGKMDDVGELYAKAYHTVKGRTYESVIVISYADVEFFNYLSIFSGDDYETPLGQIKLDLLLRDELADEDDDIYVSEKGHTSDPFIENQLPWLQTVLQPGFKLIPLVMGHFSIELCQELEKALSEVLTQKSVLVVVAADLVYAGKDSKTAEKLTKEALEIVQNRNFDQFFNRKWRSQIQSGALGPLYVGANVGWNLGFKTTKILGQKEVNETRASGEVTVSYFSVAIGR